MRKPPAAPFVCGTGALRGPMLREMGQLNKNLLILVFIGIYTLVRVAGDGSFANQPPTLGLDILLVSWGKRAGQRGKKTPGSRKERKCYWKLKSKWAIPGATQLTTLAPPLQGKHFLLLSN